MRLATKMNLVSMVILISLACAFTIAGVIAIDRIAYDLNRQVMSKEVQNIVATMRSTHRVLKESGVAGVGSYVTKAQDDLAAEFAHYQFGKTGELIVISRPNSIVFGKSLDKGRPLNFQCLSQMAAMGTGSLECVYGGEDRFFSFETYPEWNWLVMLSITTDEVTEARTQFLQRVAVIAAGSLVLCSLLFLWFTNMVAKPIRQLAAATTLMSQGEWDVPLPAPRGKDEVSELTAAFEEMYEKLATSYQSLQDKIQEIEESREALRESEERFRSLVETTSDWVWELDQHRVYTYCSPKVKDLLGYEPAELIGKVPEDFIAGVENEGSASTFRDILELKKSFAAMQKTCLHKDGHEVVIETSGVPFFDPEGRFLGFRGIDRDITERKKMEEGLLKAQKLESIGLLAGGIAHDYNNILTAILGNISLARRYASSEDPIFKRLEQTEKAALRARDLTQQLLTFARGGTPVKKTVRIAELIEGSRTLALQGSNVGSEFKMPPDLWPVDADEGQISQVMNNLIINAVQSMPEGGTVELSAENVVVDNDQKLLLQPGRYVRLSVQDHGTGIAREDLSKIFDPYFTTRPTGSGLGLTTAYSIINRHGGYISVESEPNVGTTFCIYLPASEMEAPGEEDSEAKPARGKGKVLVMDDEEIVREVLGEMLNGLGYQVSFARDGAEAISIYKECLGSEDPFEAVIIDLTIRGGMGGKEAIKRLTEIDPDIRAIVSSGYSNDPIMSNHRDYGFRGVVCKPFRMQELSRVLEQVAG